jgi:hypothetical protein
MAIVQISRIQVRRGLDSDVPQLASGELGWSIDKRRLYIGNGTLVEGAPIEGRTEVLTEQSNFLQFINTYTFRGTTGGYTSVTGATQLSPVTRSLQDKLDEAISVKDFGATGNGVTDDTVSIQRAINQIYVSGLTGVVPSLRRIIKIPAGTYFISSPILVPPNCIITGDGANNTILTSTSSSIFETCDSKYNIGPALGLNDAVLPQAISISRLQISKSANTATPVVLLDSVVNVSFEEVTVVGDSNITKLVAMTSTLNPCDAITFNKCTFNGGAKAIGAVALPNHPATNVKVTNSIFVGQTTCAIDTDLNIVGLVSVGNEFGAVIPFSGLYGDNYSIGDHASTIDPGLRAGSANLGPGWFTQLSSNTITTVPQVIKVGSAGTMDYQITDSINYRFGKISYAINSTGLTYFEDEYTETATDFLSANLTITGTGNVNCFVSNTATLQYNIKNFS